MFAASGAAAALVVGGFALWVARSAFYSGHTPLASEPVPVTAATAPAPQAAGASEPPVVNVDSLPIASGKPSVPIGHGMGRVSVAASSGSCVVSIDGINRGPTPVVDVELSAGPHKLSCAPPGGRPKSMNVLVVEGTTSKFRVALD